MNKKQLKILAQEVAQTLDSEEESLLMLEHFAENGMRKILEKRSIQPMLLSH